MYEKKRKDLDIFMLSKSISKNKNKSLRGISTRAVQGAAWRHLFSGNVFLRRYPDLLAAEKKSGLPDSTVQPRSVFGNNLPELLPAQSGNPARGFPARGFDRVNERSRWGEERRAPLFPLESNRVGGEGNREGQRLRQKAKNLAKNEA